MNNILYLVRNTLKVTFRKKGNIVIYLFLPILGILISLLIFGESGSQTVHIGLADHDQSEISAGFIRLLKDTGNYQVSLFDESELNEQLLTQKIEAAIVIPAGYERGIINASPVKIKLISLKGAAATTWLEQFSNLQTRNISDLALASGGDKRTFQRIFNRYLEEPLPVTPVYLEDLSRNKMMTMQIMGFLIMFVMLGAGFTSQIILDEKKARTYYRICSSPIKARQYLSANVVASMIIVVMQIILILLVMRFGFGIETFVPAPLMFLILLLFGLVAIGIGLITTAFSTSSYVAATLSTLIITPTCMLGGCFWPVSFMPPVMQKIAHLMPQWWTLDAIQKLQSGSGLGDILMHLLITVAFALALMLVSIYRFSRESDIRKFV